MVYETIMSKRIVGPEIERLIQLLAKVPGLDRGGIGLVRRHGEGVASARANRADAASAPCLMAASGAVRHSTR